MNKDINKKEKIVSARSSRFPSITLGYAVRVIEEASKFGKYITNSHIAGEGATKGGGFARKKASLGYYGLISGKGDKFEITSLADKIVNPLNDEEKTSAIQEAFLSPELFKKLYISTQKGKPINLSFLGNLLVREYSIQPSAKNEFLLTFIKAGIFANLARYHDDSKSEIILLDSKDNKKEVEEKSENLDPFAIFGNPQPKAPEIQMVELILTNGSGKIIVPRELTKEDAKKLRVQINLLANIFSEEDK